MFFKSKEEASDWLMHGIGIDPNSLFGGCVDHRTPESIRLDLDKSNVRAYTVATAVANTIAFPDPLAGDIPACWLLITEYGIWPSSENLHLYYMLRKAYGEVRELRDAPAHLFLSHERADLITFLHLALEFGWGGHLITSQSWTSVTFSHDGWIVVRPCELNRVEVIKLLTNLKVPMEVRNTSGRTQ